MTFCHDQAKEELGDFLQDLLQGLKDEELEQMYLDYQKRSIDARREVPRILGIWWDLMGLGGGKSSTPRHTKEWGKGNLGERWSNQASQMLGDRERERERDAAYFCRRVLVFRSH